MSLLCRKRQHTALNPSQGGSTVRGPVRQEPKCPQLSKSKHEPMGETLQVSYLFRDEKYTAHLCGWPLPGFQVFPAGTDSRRLKPVLDIPRPYIVTIEHSFELAPFNMAILEKYISSRRLSFFHVGAAVNRNDSARARHIDKVISLRNGCIEDQLHRGYVCSSHFVVELFARRLQAGVHVSVTPFDHRSVANYPMDAGLIPGVIPPPQVEVFDGSSQARTI